MLVSNSPITRNKSRLNLFYLLIIEEARQVSRYSDCLRAGRPTGRSSSSGRVKDFKSSISSGPELASTQPPALFLWDKAAGT
jgi:hypothetical protein